MLELVAIVREGWGSGAPSVIKGNRVGSDFTHLEVICDMPPDVGLWRNQLLGAASVAVQRRRVLATGEVLRLRLRPFCCHRLGLLERLLNYTGQKSGLILRSLATY